MLQYGMRLTYKIEWGEVINEKYDRYYFKQN